ncbi:MAG: hypothetical protein NC117_00640 [Pseudoflavonifractor sp.]|nr:hypothetical protein [Pseudoflavonifractor sp.]
MKNTLPPITDDSLFRPDDATHSVLRAAFEAWTAAGDMRRCRDRLKRYTYGRQWDDMTVDAHGNPCTEYELASRAGQRPLTNNLMRRLVKTVVGRFRAVYPAADGGLSSVYQSNMLPDLDARAFEDFLISGCVVQRVVRERRMRGEGIWVDNVNPRRFFVSGVCDPRGWDAELVGMLHDMTVSEAVMRFSCGDRRRAVALRQLLVDEDASLSADSPAPAFVGDGDGADDFYHAAGGRCRLIEAWTLDTVERLVCHDPATGRVSCAMPGRQGEVEAVNRRRVAAGLPPFDVRWEMAAQWVGRWITPSGRLIARVPSPWPHGEHPFVFSLYPMTDGEIHPFVEDVVDQQRYVNRLVTLIDNIMGSSAKGVLLFPDDQISPLMPWDQVAQRWAATDGVIPYRPKGDRVPTQVYSRNNDVGAYNLLALEMRLFDEVSGVGSALQGKDVSGAVSASLYEQQTRNSALSLTDVFESFAGFRAQRDSKLLALRDLPPML